jgi:Predicted transcriptional regulators
MIGDKLKELRQSTGMNKKEFAAHIEMKYTTYNNYEIGAREPASDFLIMISKKFDVSIDYLMGVAETKEKFVEKQLSAHELLLLEKYSKLDMYGKSLIDAVLDRELLRAIEQYRNFNT